MDEIHDNRDPDGLEPVARRLRAERVVPTPLELDRIKLNVKSRAANPRALGSRQKGTILKSRLALTSMLVVGLLMSFGGAGLAVTGIADQGSAGQAQYPTLGTQDRGGGDEAATLGQEATPDSGSGPDSDSGPAGADTGQAGDQVAADTGDSLPFTGLLAIPLLLLGSVLFVVGAVFRKRLPEARS